MADTITVEREPRSLLGDDLAGVLSRYRRYIPLVLIIAAAVMGLAIIATFLMTPKYTAEATLQYNPEKQLLAATPNQDQASAPSDVQDQAVDTQTAALTSPDLALKVEADLGLDKDPEFTKGVKSLKFTADESADRRAQDVRDTVAAAVAKKLKVKRVGQTLLISVAFTSTSPMKAARIANAFAQSYLDQQVAAKLQQGQTTSTQINSQLQGLRQAVQDADAAVQQYKIANNLMNVSTSQVDAGAQSTIVQQEVIALNDQLALARADAAGAQARLNAAQTQLQHGESGETVGAAIESPVIAELRRQYAEASRRVADLETNYGPSYPDLIAAKSEMVDLNHQIHEQVDRILSSLQSEANVAGQRLASIQASLNAARGQLAAGNVASVQLADLQRTADAAKSQYEAFLSSANAVSGQNVVVKPDSQISTPAGVPFKPSSPNLLLNTAIGLVFGLFLGTALAFILDQWSASCATMEDIERNLGLAYAGALPTVVSSISKPSASNPIDAVVAHPLSSFAEAFRNLAAFLMYSPSGKPINVIAVTSALPKEGKTATSICLARVLALSGSRVALLDTDLRRRSATEALAPKATTGLIEVLDGKATLEDAFVLDKATGVHFLPLTDRAHLAKSPLESKAMDDLLARLRQEFQVVILDTAPVLAVVDTRTLVKKVDSLVMLVAWRATPAKAVRAAIHLITSVGGTVSGGALTMVNLKSQTQSGYGDPSYYYRNIKGYYAS